MVRHISLDLPSIQCQIDQLVPFQLEGRNTFEPISDNVFARNGVLESVVEYDRIFHIVNYARLSGVVGNNPGIKPAIFPLSANFCSDNRPLANFRFPNMLLNNAPRYFKNP